ncbi:MAG: NUDIX domain-containing protein [Chloroflexi bacterium]|nr:NUDIX domain-containing protein [Chloroflexota bacterium]
MSGRIRPIAIAIFRRGDDELLVLEGYDRVKQQHFVRPAGGGIEFGERAEDAVRREIREELGAEIDNVRLLGTTENIYVFEDEPGHEVVFVYEADFRDPAFYAREVIDAFEDSGEPFRLVWVRLAELLAEGEPFFYPDGIADLLVRRG